MFDSTYDDVCDHRNLAIAVIRKCTVDARLNELLHYDQEAFMPWNVKLKFELSKWHRALEMRQEEILAAADLEAAGRTPELSVVGFNTAGLAKVVYRLMMLPADASHMGGARAVCSTSAETRERRRDACAASLEVVSQSRSEDGATEVILGRKGGGPWALAAGERVLVSSERRGRR